MIFDTVSRNMYAAKSTLSEATPSAGKVLRSMGIAQPIESANSTSWVAKVVHSLGFSSIPAHEQSAVHGFFVLDLCACKMSDKKN
jgi:hypothetical protein